MIHITAKRACRYKDKLDLVFKRAGQVQEWMGEVSEEDFLEDDKTKLAVYKAFQDNRRDDLLAMQSMKDLQNGIITFGEEVEMWLEKMLPPQ